MHLEGDDSANGDFDRDGIIAATQPAALKKKYMGAVFFVKFALNGGYTWCEPVNSFGRDIQNWEAISKGAL